MPASTPVPVMVPVLVDQLSIVRAPGKDQWVKLREQGGEVQVRLGLSTPMSSMTFDRVFTASNIEFEPGTTRVTFFIKHNHRRMRGTVEMRTGEGPLQAA